MPSVFYNKTIQFRGHLYNVSQTWNGPEPDVTVQPPCQDLHDQIVHRLKKNPQLELKWGFGFFELP